MLPLLVALVTTCPQGSAAKERSTAEAREAWCEDAAGRRQGTRRAWYSSGKPWFEGDYADGKRDGAWKFWHDAGGVMATLAYRDDKADGPMTRFYESGEKSVEGTCRAGSPEGLWRRYWPNGKLEVECSFREGKAVGPAAFYSRRGAPLPFEQYAAEKRAKVPASPEQLFADCAD